MEIDADPFVLPSFQGLLLARVNLFQFGFNQLFLHFAGRMGGRGFSSLLTAISQNVAGTIVRIRTNSQFEQDCDSKSNFLL